MIKHIRPANRRDHQLLLLGEALSAVDRALAAGGDEIENDRHLARWYEIIGALVATTATTKAGRRIKAAALIAYVEKTGSIPRDLALSLAGDELR